MKSRYRQQKSLIDKFEAAEADVKSTKSTKDNGEDKTKQFEYEVEKVLKKRSRKGKTEYFVNSFGVKIYCL